MQVQVFSLYLHLHMQTHENIVAHILGGEVYGMAVRGHLLEDDGLHTILAA